MMLEQEMQEFDSFLKDFKNYIQMRAKGKLRDVTLLNYSKHLRILILKHGLPMTNPTIEDFRLCLESRVIDISAATINTAIVVARKYAEFHNLDPSSKEMRQIFQFKRVIPTKRFTREDILTPDDMVPLLSLMPTRHYRAFFAVLWDTGARVGEICSLNYEDVTKDEHGFTLDIKKSKTTPRRLRLVTEIGLKHFSEHYELHEEGEPLFQMRNRNAISPTYANTILKNRRKIIGKKLCCQLFRKSASSWWKSSGLFDDRDIRVRMGHKPWSKMFERYYELYFQPDYEAAELRALNGSGHESEPESEPEVTITNLLQRIERLEKETESQEHGPALE